MAKSTKMDWARSIENLWARSVAMELILEGLVMAHAISHTNNPRGQLLRDLKAVRDSVKVEANASPEDVTLARGITRQIDQMQKQIDDNLAALGYEAIPTGAADAGHTE